MGWETVVCKDGRKEIYNYSKMWQEGRVWTVTHQYCLVSFPDLLKSGKWCSDWHCLSHGLGPTALHFTSGTQAFWQIKYSQIGEWPSLPCGKKTHSEYQTPFLECEMVWARDWSPPERKRGKTGAGRRKGERKEGDGRRKNKAERERKDWGSWYTSTLHILQSSQTNLHTILPFESFFPLVLQCAHERVCRDSGSRVIVWETAVCPLWKSSCVAEGETVVVGSWSERL